MESVEGDTNASNGESDELQFDHQKSAGNEEDDGDEESIFPPVINLASSRATASVRRAAQLMPLTTTTDAPLSIGRATKANPQPIEVERPERVNNSSIDVGGSDVDASPVSTSPGSNADGAMPSPMLGGREAPRLEWTAAGPTGTVDGRTRGDFRRLQAVQSAGLLAGEVDLVSAREDSGFRATQGESEVCDALYVSLLQEFQTTQGKFSWYLGCAFERDKAGGVQRMSQRAFIESVASRCGVDTVSGLPVSQSADLGPRMEGEPVCDNPVRAAVGSLIWVGGMTRPDIANTVRAVAHQAHDPAERHWRTVYKIISYLNGTNKLGLVFSKEGGVKLSVYVDADYADKANDRRSVSGVAVMLGGTSVIASSTTQHCVTLFTSETEHVAMAQGAKTALFTRAVLAFLQPQLVGRITHLFEDNQGAIAMVENPISTKHIDVRYHFIREQVKHKVIAIKCTESRNPRADILTKAIGAEGFVRHRRFLMNLPE